MVRVGRCREGEAAGGGGEGEAEGGGGDGGDTALLGR